MLLKHSGVTLCYDKGPHGSFMEFAQRMKRLTGEEVTDIYP